MSFSFGCFLNLHRSTPQSLLLIQLSDKTSSTLAPSNSLTPSLPMIHDLHSPICCKSALNIFEKLPQSHSLLLQSCERQIYFIGSPMSESFSRSRIATEWKRKYGRIHGQIRRDSGNYLVDRQRNLQYNGFKLREVSKQGSRIKGSAFNMWIQVDAYTIIITSIAKALDAVTKGNQYINSSLR